MKATIAGSVGLGFITIVIVGAAIALVGRGGGDAAGAFDAYLLQVVRFTIWQATLSSVLSVLVAVPLAIALSRLPDLPGHAFIVRLFGLPLALPAIVAVFGVLAVWGRNGWFADGLAAIGVDDAPSIYGLPGILIAHVFFNAPLAARLLLEQLDRIALEQWRTAQQLGMNGWAIWRYVEWPSLRVALPGIAGLVFMLCLTSFAIVLVLGGGPGATTLEVAIYQALRFDFDPGRAVALAAVQLALTLTILSLLSLSAFSLVQEPGLKTRRPDTMSSGPKAVAVGFVVLATAFVALPLLATVVDGIAADLVRLAGESSVRRAFFTSILVAVPAAMLAVGLALALLEAERAAQNAIWSRLLAVAGSITLVVPPVLIGAGWFVYLAGSLGETGLGAALLVATNALIALPFAVRVLKPALDHMRQTTDRLSAMLAIDGWRWVRLVGWPVLRRPLATAAMFAAALSLGDLGAIAMLASDDLVTLPYLLMQRLGSYRTDDAAGIALILTALALAIFTVGDRLRRATS